MVKDSFVMISSLELRRLVQNAEAFEALCQMGVDNWQGYDEVDWDDVEYTVHLKLEELGVK